MNPRSARPGVRMSSRAVITLLLGSLAGGCAADRPTAAVAVEQGTAAQLRPMAFTFEVNARNRTISIAPPVASTADPSAISAAKPAAPNLSLLAGDVVQMLASNVRTSAVGAFTPNRIRVTFDVSIENRLPGIRLVTPTWPVAPATGVILFPIEFVVTLAPGGVSGSGGNTLLVEQPRFGTVTPSADFDGTGTPGSGAPYNFFNDADCSQGTSNDCFRWKAYEPSIAPQSVSAKRTIGFDIDPSVAQFRARMIVAADLAPAPVVARVGTREP